MAVAIRVPDLGTTVDEIKLLSWLVEEGETVERGQPIAEIETDKAVSDLECVADGVVLKLVVEAETSVETGTVLAYVGQPGEAVPEQAAPAAPAPAAEAKAPAPTTAAAHRVSAVVRNLAEKLGVDLADVQGSGQGGMITRQDVIQASQGAKAAPAGEPLSRAQTAVARAVSASHREIPHLRITAEIDMTAADRLRKQTAAEGRKISYDALFVRAMAAGIQAVPLVAARTDGQHVTRPEGIHIALAVGFEDALFLPVIRDADTKDLAALQAEIAEVAARCKAGTIRPEEMTGGCITLSNLGMYPIEGFDAIIFPEHASILAVGAVRERPVAVDGQVVTRRTAMATVAVDHRLINGRAAAAFLTRVKEVLEADTDEA